MVLNIHYDTETDDFTIYAWVKPLRYKRAETVLHGFIEIVNESKRKSNKL